jgi:hypothetical protein
MTLVPDASQGHDANVTLIGKLTFTLVTDRRADLCRTDAALSLSRFGAVFDFSQKFGLDPNTAMGDLFGIGLGFCG